MLLLFLWHGLCEIRARVILQVARRLGDRRLCLEGLCEIIVSLSVYFIEFGLSQLLCDEKLKRISLVGRSNTRVETSGEVVHDSFPLDVLHYLAGRDHVSSGQDVFWFKQDAPRAITADVELLSQRLCDSVLCSSGL